MDFLSNMLTWEFLLTWENLAAALAVAYLLLAMHEKILCWYAALVSTSIYTVLFWNVSLLMDSALSVYYIIMAVYGWWQWRKGGNKHTEGSNSHSGVSITSWGLREHSMAFSAIVVVSLISGWLLSNNTSASWPYLDSFTTWASVLTTWMVAKKILENWLYWILIDGVSIILYVDKELYSTAILFVAYVVIVIFGYFKWRRLFSLQNETDQQNIAEQQISQQASVSPRA